MSSVTGRTGTIVFLLSVLLPHSYSEIRSKDPDAYEGPCLDPTPKVPKGVNYGWILAPGTPMYVPLASAHMYRAYAEYLLGRPPVDELEVQNMQLKINYIGPFVRNTGYSEWVGQFCIPVNYNRPNIADMQCFGTLGSRRANATLISYTHDTLVWTDNKTAMFFVRCTKGERDYKILSTLPKLSKSVVLKALELVRELGFDKKKLQFMKYYDP